MSEIVVDTDKLMFQTLEKYLFQNVWNTPLTECRRNITLRAESKGRACVNTVNLGCMYTDLPYASMKNKKAYYVYSAAKCCMGGIVVDTTLPAVESQLEEKYRHEDASVYAPKSKYLDGWISLKDYLNIRPFDLRIHGIFGQWLYRDEIMIKNHPYEDMFLIAVEKTMAQKILGKDYDFYTLYMSVYYDSDNDLGNLAVTSPMIQCFHPEAGEGDTLNAAFNAYNDLTDNQKDKTMCFIDGRESTPTSLEDIQFGQYVEIVYDPDIICNIIMDLTDPEQSNIYRSVIDSTYKYIVHVPKTVNPLNHIITHNTCDIFIRPVNTSLITNIRLKGLFVHRFNTSDFDYQLTTDETFVAGRAYYKLVGSDFVLDDTVKSGDPIPENTYYKQCGILLDKKITQITHNDFGISEKLLQPYMEHIGSSECAIRVVVRKHRKASPLRYDCNFLNNLYSFDDATILQMLTGRGPVSLSFWKAAELEQSPFIKMLFHVPPKISVSNAQKYIDALGYYNSMSILTPKVNRYIFGADNIRKFSAGIPVSMLTCETVRAIVSVNGIKLDEEQYTSERNNQYLDITINDDIELKVNDRIVVELFDGPWLKAGYFTPVIDGNVYRIDNVPYAVYEVFDDVTVNEDYYTNNYMSGTHRGFKLVENIRDVVLKEEVVGDKQDLYFSDLKYGQTYLICSKEVYQVFGNDKIEAGGGNVTLGGVPTYNDTTTTTDLLHSGILKVTAKHWQSGEFFELPIFNQSWNVLCYLNGRELVQGIDFMFRDIAKNGIVVSRNVFFNNISYLGDENKFEIVLTSDQPFMNYNGFTHWYDDVVIANTDPRTVAKIEEINPYVFWFNRLCSACADGSILSGINTFSGSLWVTETCRQGALYGVRGLIPSEAKEFLDQFSTNEEDVRKLTAIAEYIRSRVPEYPRSVEVIEHSHHIASIMMNAIVKDVLTGKKRINYTTDMKEMREQLKEYSSLRKYDAAMTGVAMNLTIFNAGSSIVNNTYLMFNPEAVGLDRMWRNETNRIRLWWNCETKRWEISSTVATQPNYIYYYADDPEGKFDPWDLDWEVGPVGVGHIPEFLKGALDLQYIDLFPSYSSDLHVIVDDITLRQAIKAIFPVDSVIDGDTVR